MPPTDPALARQVSRASRWLVWIFIAAVASTVALLATFKLRGESSERAWNRTVLSVIPPLYAREYSEDSWGPMGRAFLRSQSREDGDIYGIFFDEKKKFQYPPTSLLIFFAFPDSWLGPENFIISENFTTLKGPTLAVLRITSQLAILVTIAASIAILEIGIRRLGGPGAEHPAWKIVRIGIGCYLGLTFYPVIWAHGLGQIQVHLNALTALGVLAHLLGYRAASGISLGLCCLVKPQYALLLIWAVLRRHWRFVAGFSAAVLPLGLLSLALFGWDNHIRYIGVIREIARVGESFWANQSVNGFVNRLIGNGDAINFSPVEFAPYHPLVHSITIASSLLIIGLAMFRGKTAAREDTTLDLAVIIAAATMASPIAWEHHYGAFLPLFALALPACLKLTGSPRLSGMVLGASFLAVSVAVLAPDEFFFPRWRNWAASHLFFGAVLLFGLLIHLRRLSAVAATADSMAKDDSPSPQAVPHMNSFWYYLIHLAAFAGGVALLTTLKRHNASWPIRATAAAVMSILMAVFMFRISEPPQVFADFYKAYYPAAKALFASDPNGGLSATMREGAGGFVNLPVLAWLFAPFGKLPTPAAGYAFMALGVAAIISTWQLLARLAGLDRDRTLLLLFVFASFGPLHNSLREGNTTHFVLLLIVSGLWALRRNRGFLAGLLIGFAALVKLPLLLLGIYFAARGRWRVAMGGATVCAVAVILSIALFGWDLHVFWYENSIKPFAKTPMAAFNVQSVQGFLARLDHGGKYLLDWTPHAVHPMAQLASRLAVVVLLLSAAFVMFRPRPLRRKELPEAPASTVIELEVGIVTLLAMMISMVSWSHYFLWVLLPGTYVIAGNPSVLGTNRLRIPGLAALILAMPPVLKVFSTDPILSRIYCYLAVSHYLIGAALLFTVLLVTDWQTRPVESGTTE